jgi:hypothetical protein
MKKLPLSLVLAGVVFGLVACDFADGVSHEFGVKAETIFEEIDDDTMTKELSDADDVGNFDLLGVEADSEREVAFVNGLEGMLKLQDKVVAGDREALKEYLKARKSALNALGLGENDEYHSVPQFQFYEEE